MTELFSSVPPDSRLSEYTEIAGAVRSRINDAAATGRIHEANIGLSSKQQ
jgi:hypothetical protein